MQASIGLAAAIIPASIGPFIAGIIMVSPLGIIIIVSPGFIIIDMLLPAIIEPDVIELAANAGAAMAASVVTARAMAIVVRIEVSLVHKRA
jgi:hypothetical protein